MKAANSYASVCGVRNFWRSVLTGLILAVFGVRSHANTFTWTGGGGANANWSNSGNWGFQGPPADGDTVIFPGGAANLINTNDIFALMLGQIRFAGSSGGYQIWGNGFTITNSIYATNTSGNNFIMLTNVCVISNNDLSVTVGNGITLGIASGFTGSFGLIKNGPGILNLSGPLSSTYLGTTIINQGVLQTQKAASPPATAIPGNLIIGDGVNSAELQNIFNIETSTNANITINSNGVWDLSGHFDNMGSNLTLNGNAIVTNANALTLAPNATVTGNPGGAQNCAIYGTLNVNSSGVCTFFANNAFSTSGFFDIAANIIGSATINSQGPAYFQFEGANTFTGQLNVLAGRLGVVNSLALGSTNTGMTVSNTAQLWLYDSVTNKPLTIASTGRGLVSPSGAPITWLASNITLAAQTTIEVDGLPALNLQCLLTGPGGFTKIGPGALTLSGNGENTYFGATAVNQGVLQLNQSGGHAIGGSSSITIGDGIGGPNADVIRYIGPSINEILSGIPITITKSGLMDLNGQIDDVGPITMDGGNITTGTGTLELLNAPIATLSSGNGASTISGNLLLEASGLDTFAISNTLNINASISGAAGETLVKLGQGYLVLNASNSYAGVTAVNEGWVWAQNNFALGSTANGTFVSNSATLVLSGGVAITNEALTLNGVGEPGWAALDCEFFETNIWAGPITMSATSTFANYGGGTLRLIGPISGPGGLDEIAGGTLTLEGATANTYGGNTSIDGGILLLNKTAFVNAIPGNVNVNSGTLRLGNTEQIANTAKVFVNNGSLFDFGAFNESIDMLTGGGSVTFATFGYLQIGANNGTSTFNGVMSGVGYPSGYTVGKIGSGTFTMNGNNTYQNGNDVFGGTLIINGVQQQSPVLAVNSGTTLGGSGVVGDIQSVIGTVAPGIAGGTTILTCSNAVFNSSGNFTVKLNGPAPGSGYDQLVARGGTVNPANATLTLLPSPGLSYGQQFTIIDNQGGNPIVGTFNGIPNNSFVSAGGYNFLVNYNGGTGNDMVLTLVSSTVTLNSVAKGWYDSTGFHNPGNNNYLAGEDSIGTNLFRNFFVFNAPVSSSDIIYAELIINGYNVLSPQGQELYLVRGVSTPVATLEAGGSGLTNIYLDLGSSNAVYGQRSISTNESHQFVIIPLNVKFIKDITAASGGQIALGGSIVSLSPTNNNNELVFGNSGVAPNDAQLRLTYGNSVTLNAAHTGWYDNSGAHSFVNSNYITGTLGVSTYHDFFVFNLPFISGPLVTSGLLVSNYTVNNLAGSNPYQLFDVTTPITTLTNDAAGATGTFDDLASGISYGGRDIYVNESRLQSGIPLDSEFVSAVYAHSGGQIALGGANASTNGVIFSSSGFSTNDAKLWLGFLNAPAVTPVFTKSTNLGNSTVQFTLSGTSGTSNEIQGSFDFQNWDYVGDLFMTNTTSAFVYTNNPAFPYRFFRARMTP